FVGAKINLPRTARPLRSRPLRSRHDFLTCQRPKTVGNGRSSALLLQVHHVNRGRARAAPAKETTMGLLMRSLFAAVLMAAGWYSSYIAIASAQDAQREAPSPGVPTPAPGLTEQKLNAAAAALERVASLQKTYRQRLAEAPARADKERIVA